MKVLSHSVIAVFALAIPLRLLSLVGFAPPPLLAAESARDIVASSLQAYYYQGHDMKARVNMELESKSGRIRRRELTLLRVNGEGGEQRYFVYFHKPGDVRKMTFLVWKYPDRDDERWLYIPAVDLVRKVAAEDKRSSFVGSDFTYEDVSGRNVDDDTHVLLGEEQVSARPCFKIESRPKEKLDYARRIIWVDRATRLPLKEEYYSAHDQLIRMFTADNLTPITVGDATYPTLMMRTMKNLISGTTTRVTFTKVSYDLGLKESDFNERHMKRPPRVWLTE